MRKYRRIAQWQSASKHTEEAAAFESCSAYQPPRTILFLSHCVPNPPDKGEKIRAYHLLNALCARFRVHLVCFTRERDGLEYANALRDRCASVYVERLWHTPALAGAVTRFGFGACLTTSFYRSTRMARHIDGLRREPLFATFAYSSAMAPYAPDGIPLFLDMVDVDSEKWADYARMRFPGLVYSMESERLRQLERKAAMRAVCTWLASEQERDLLKAFSAGADVRCLEGGVDCEYFDPRQVRIPQELAGHPIAVFTGAMDYYPNVNACCWFATKVLPQIRRRIGEFEFFIVGRSPTKAVRQLASIAGVTVTGAVPDVRPYLAAARVAVAPLRVARGMQNKVLEALSMGKRVLVTSSVCRTFGDNLPFGLERCDRAADYAAAVEAQSSAIWAPEVRHDVQQRFSWERFSRSVCAELERLSPSPIVSTL